MQPPSPRCLLPPLGWLLLAQILWIPLLLQTWIPSTASKPPLPTTGAGREALPPLPAAAGRRSTPPSLAELLTPASAPRAAAEPPVSRATGADGLILLNRPGTKGSTPSGPPPPQASGAASPQTAFGPTGSSGNAKPRLPAAAALISPSQLLGGSLGLEELRPSQPASPSP